MLPKFVPAAVLGWLAEEGTLLQELADYPCGERRDGALAELVGAGGRESVRRNLLIGPRQRFATARTAPLIERLMEALRRMLADSAWLPLNRDGAAGWVADDAVWFVSKRLADAARRFLQTVPRHNSRREYLGVRCLQTRADSAVFSLDGSPSQALRAPLRFATGRLP